MILIKNFLKTSIFFKFDYSEKLNLERFTMNLETTVYDNKFLAELFPGYMNFYLNSENAEYIKISL